MFFLLADMAECAPTYLIVGKSGGGKSFFAERLCANFAPSKVVLLNNKKKKPDLGGVEVLELGWKDVPLPGETRVCYLIEDVVALAGEARTKTYELLNVTSRHTNSPVIVVTHSAVGTGLFGALSYVNNVVLTQDRVNKRALKLLLRHFLFEDPDQVEAKFNRLKKRQYLLIRPSEFRASAVDADMRADADETRPAATKDDLLAHFPPDAGPLVEFLINNMPAGAIRQPDLSVHCREKGGGLVRISFIDYISCLRDRGACPDNDLRRLHRLLCRTICFPSTLVANTTLLRLSQEEKKIQRRREER